MKYSIKDQFEAAVSVIQNLPKNGTFQPSTSLMLLFYSYYKQARNGECKSSRPAFYDPVGQSKWEAWKGLGSMSSEQAMQLYVAELKKIAEIMPQSKEVENFIEKIGGIYEMVDEEEEEENGKIDYNSENNAKQCNDTNGNKDDSKGEDGGRSVVPIKKESKVVNEESSLKSSKESHKRGKSNTRRNNSKKKNRAYNVNYGSFNSKNRGIFEELDKELDKELVKRQFDADYDNDGLIFKEKAFDQNKRKEYFSNDVNEGDKVIVNDNEVDTKNEGAMNNSDNIITNTKITTDNIVKTIDKNDTNDNETSINNEKTAISSLIDLHSDRVLSDCYSSNDEFLDTFEFLDCQLPVNIKYLSETNCASKCMGNGLSLEASSFEHNNDRKTKDNDKDGDFNDSSDKGLHKNNEKSRGFGIQKQAADLDSILFMPQNGDLKQQNNDIKQQEDSVKIISEPSTSSSSSYIKSKRKNKSFLNYQTKTKIDRQNSHEDNKALSTCENLNTVNGRNSSQSRNNDEIKEILLILQSSLTQLRKDVKELHTSVKDFQDVKSLIPSLPTTIFIIVWPIIISMAFRYMSSRRW